ncbi:MAG: peroxiredoxin-like family protein [Pseudomonadota bacterium]
MPTGLKDKLSEIAQKLDPVFGGHQSRILALLERIEQLERRVPVGAQAPDFVLPDQNGSLVSSQELLGKGPLVVVFVRGIWCPYCSEQIRALVEAAEAFAKAGIGLAVVTPEVGGRAKQAADTHAAPFPILCDVDMGVALSFGCLYMVPPEEREFLKSKGIDLAERSGSNAGFLPIASGFGIARDGQVLRVFGMPDQRERPEPMDMLDEMRSALGTAQA